MCISFGNPSDPCCDDAPAVPALGFIQRHFYPEAIPDDAGLSDAQWSTGITGDLATQFNRSCLYHHFTTPDQKNTSVFNVLQPLRFSIESPSNDGGEFDHWYDLTVGGTDPEYQSGQLTFDGVNTAAIRDKLLPRDWHARFVNSIANFANWPVPSVCRRDFDAVDLTGVESYLERSLQAIAPSVPPWQLDGSEDNFPVTTQTWAFRHVINGVPGRIFFPYITAHDYGTSVRVTPTDIYQIDIWFKIGIAGLPNHDAIPGKGCVYWPLRRVSDGSRQGSPYLLTFYNVDFSPAYDPAKQAYSLTVAGHSGWTLRNGSNGPHVLTPASNDNNWSAESGDAGAVVQTYNPSSFWSRIVLDFSREIASAFLVPGDAMRAKYPEIGHAFLYRPVDNPGLYRKSTRSADYGSVTHAHCGRFYQDGTTVFELVPWTVEGGLGGVDYTFQPALGRADSGNSPPVYREVPRRLIFSRVSR